MHTKGNWEVVAECDGQKRALVGVMKTNSRVADVGDAGMTTQESNANAHLIAAAPDLAEALSFCRSVIKKNGMYDLSEHIAFQKATDALKKARVIDPAETEALPAKKKLTKKKK